MAMFKNTRKWLYALLQTVIGGAATSLAAKLALPNTIVDWNDWWKVAGFMAASNLVFFLAKSPLPEQGGDTEIKTKSCSSA